MDASPFVKGSLVRIVDSELSRTLTAAAIWRIADVDHNNLHIEPVYGLFGINQRLANRIVTTRQVMPLTIIELGIEYASLLVIIQRAANG